VGNQLETAIKAAGVKVPPLKKRIWLWLKDHPHKTAHDLSLVLHQPIARVCTQLLKMRERDMVSAKFDPARKLTKGRRPLEYIALGATYELKHLRAAKSAASVLHPGKPNCGPVTDVTHKTVHLTTVRVPDMPLAKAFALYQELKGYFAS
jgi:hypothetical protein